MKLLALAAALLVLPAFSSFSQSTDTDISNYNFADTEPFIAIDPVNPAHLIAGWMKLTGIMQVSIQTRSSFDGGATWSSGTTLPHLWSSFTSADVSIDFDSSGAPFICYIDYATSLDSGYVVVAGSGNGGLTWNAPVKVTSLLEKPDEPIDRPWIAIDRSSGPYSGRMYVTSKSTESGAAPHHIWMKSSSDNGATWSGIIQLDDSIAAGSNSKSMAVPAVGADGTLYAAYFSYNPSQSLFVRSVLLRSADGGNTFTPYIIENLTGASAISDSLYQFSYTLSANPASSSNLVFTWTDGRYGDADILASVSNNSGTSWSAPVRVNDDAPGNGVGQDMSWAGFSAGGKYAAAWRDRRNGGTSSQSPFEIYTAISLNGGSSFTPNYRLSSAASPFINIQKGNDFIGAALNDNYIVSDWCDLRAGNTEIFFRKEQLSTVIGIEAVTGNIKGLSCFPNPSSKEVTVQLETSSEQLVSITLFDMQGKQVLHLEKNAGKGTQSITFDISQLIAGTYICRVACKEGTADIKLGKK
jgi:hypothetical protein